MKETAEGTSSVYKRIGFALVGFVVGFFISVVVLVLLFTLPLSMLGLYGLVGASIFAVLTFLFPRIMGWILFFLTLFQ